ncbi:EF-P lysine aminoacylase EpmA [Suttonella ornithocola]|uniref:PoxB regulator PoxA n=1 Tax=Suttonella ornithocola TaxID=279832 RepID=A0A380MTK7_9GAMM|nr:EF-P lysine aminoacylase EpmA [Suttonella ornithocola]SUO95612.1 poxB regulator PoxA [Suttonella ornithocola]
MNTSALIIQRANFLAKIRAFFAHRHIYEVDTSLLTAYGVTDVNLTSLTADNGYLITSPEYAMKTLLTRGAPDIYQLSHVFRGEEQGRKHRKEFMLLEWYRLDFTHQQLMQEVGELIQYLLKPRTIHIDFISYAQCFQETLSIDLFHISDNQLKEFCHQKIPESQQWQLDRDGYTDLLFTHFIEPNLGKNKLQFITDYPPSQAALAKIIEDKNGHLVAARFEAYLEGLELCNGFYELNQPAEQRARFEDDNHQRKQLGLPSMPIDEPFLKALENGLPDCAGVAVGIDRLFMIACQANHIEEVIFL